MMKQLGADGFRPHEGDPSSLRRKSLHRVLQFKVSVPTKGTHLLYSQQKIKSYLMIGFRPHEGDPSSLHSSGNYRKIAEPFPSPRRGPIFSTDALEACKDADKVSVPTKGTHLLYDVVISHIRKEVSVSVPTKGTHLLYSKKSSCRE